MIFAIYIDKYVIEASSLMVGTYDREGWEKDEKMNVVPSVGSKSLAMEFGGAIGFAADEKIPGL